MARNNLRNQPPSQSIPYQLLEILKELPIGLKKKVNASKPSKQSKGLGGNIVGFRRVSVKSYTLVFFCRISLDRFTLSDWRAQENTH